MRTKDLKELYLKERKKLEVMPVYQQQSKIQFVLLKKKILTKAKENLSISEIEGREDIDEEVKDILIRDLDKRRKLEERISDIIEEELNAIDQEESDERKSANYEPREFGEYLLQLEKVSGLEGAIVEAQSYPNLVSDNIYGEEDTSEPKESAS
ncbi:MAG: hypothetical protein WC628_07995 [Candidatus Omnitrophota bacterium]